MEELLKRNAALDAQREKIEKYSEQITSERERLLGKCTSNQYRSPIHSTERSRQSVLFSSNTSPTLNRAPRVSPSPGLRASLFSLHDEANDSISDAGTADSDVGADGEEAGVVGGMLHRLGLSPPRAQEETDPQPEFTSSEFALRLSLPAPSGVPAPPLGGPASPPRDTEPSPDRARAADESPGALHLGGGVSIPEGDLSSDVLVRLQQARLQALEADHARLTEELRAQGEELRLTQQRAKATAKEAKDLGKLNHRLEQDNTRLGGQLQTQTQRADKLQTELQAAQRELAGLHKEHRQTSSTTSRREVRLNRALEDAESLRTQLRQTEGRLKEATALAKQREDAVRSEARKFQRQKAELLTAFRKQMRLIDVLKRQKMHLEAARLFAFSEAEFMKALELGEKL